MHEIIIKIVEIEQIAESKGLHLLPLQRLIDEKIVDFFDGHGSPPAEFKGKGDVPYIRVKDIVNWEIYKDPTSKITKEIYHLYYTYTEITNKALNLNLILKLKRCNLNDIDINELNRLCLILDELKTNYIFSSEDERLNIELFKQEALKIWTK